MWKSLLVFHWNYVCISYRFWDIQRQRMAWPWNMGRGCSRSYDFLLVGHCKYSCMLYHFIYHYLTSNNYDLEKVIEGHSNWYHSKACVRLTQISRSRYFVTLKSGLEVTQGHSNWHHSKAWCGFLFTFHSNYGRIFNHLWDIQRQSIAWPWKLG